MQANLRLLRITPAIRLTEHFDIPEDDTDWFPIGTYSKVSSGNTPARPHVRFRWKDALHPKTPKAIGLENTSGLYMLAAKVPYKAIYVGIAAGDGKSPEGILNRIRKHRVKITASHVGSERVIAGKTIPSNVGGVSHTGHWRKFAADRYSALKAKDMLPDICADIQLATGHTCTDRKHLLECFESDIFHNQRAIRERLCEHFWPGEDNSNIFILTSQARKLCLDFEASYEFESCLEPRSTTFD